AAAPPPRQAPPPEAPRAASGSPSELLKSVEDVQRKEVAALKAMVELLIEKGIFSREEYLAKVKR
ncbi:general secretion pathway protein GspE, partial [Corallococcus sp. AB032C]